MAAETASARRFGVAGYPVAHSLSPQMHEAAYRELAIEARYQRLPIPPELFEETVRALPGSGFSGINVTIPHKEAAAQLASVRTPAVDAIGAANTLTFVDGEIHAENTDAPGLISALGSSVEGKRALVLGAGGTARAAVWALAGAGAQVEIFNRTLERAALLASEFGVSHAAGTGGGASFDLIVNTTSVGMEEGVDGEQVARDLGLNFDMIDPEARVIDFVYRSGGSPLANAARERGLDVVDGRELLVRQGALSFELWLGLGAPLDAMRAAIAQ